MNEMWKTTAHLLSNMKQMVVIRNGKYNSPYDPSRKLVERQTKNKRDKNKKLVFDMQVVKNQLNAIVIFSVRVFQLKNGICSHLFS